MRRKGQMSNYGRSDRNQRQQSQHKSQHIEYPSVQKPLSTYFNDAKDLYLPSGRSYQIAEDFKEIASHQLRKILNGTKQAIILGSTDFDSAQKQMFMLVAMTAYNKGRMGNKLMPLYKFMSSTINESSIKTMDDIKTFDTLFTSIVAYHKLIAKGN